MKTLELRKYLATSCKDIAKHLHFLFIIALDFFKAEKRFTLITYLREMLYILLLHIVKEVRHDISRVRHVRMCQTNLISRVYTFVSAESFQNCHQVLLILHIFSNFVKKPEKYK